LPISGEQRIFQGVIDSLYERFVALVAESRNITPASARALADGRIFTSREAGAAGLIDGIGYLDDAVEEAKKLAGLAEATAEHLRDEPHQHRDGRIRHAGIPVHMVAVENRCQPHEGSSG
jgi:ClpP class serine protease